MCTINEYISRTGCGHNVEVFSRCANAIKEGQMQCNPTYIAEPIPLDNERCEHCEIEGKNKSSQDQKSKPNRARELFKRLLQHSRRIKPELPKRVSSPRFQRVTSAIKGRWKGGQGIRKKRSKPMKWDRIEFDAACVDYLTTELDYGEAKESGRPKSGIKKAGTRQA
ncbi:hypothetical protein TWF506_009311 [Arthrobotrys conoides]|uniref:Uncharacterized protein n=1 Tax=Arthrobotrys conoides TaxID=74498 RepID=A0AAN8NDJ6_9PEZI